MVGAMSMLLTTSSMATTSSPQRAGQLKTSGTGVA